MSNFTFQENYKVGRQGRNYVAQNSFAEQVIYGDGENYR